MIIVIGLVLLIIWCIKECREVHQFAYDGLIQEIQRFNPIVIQENLKSKNPLLLHNVKIRTLDISDILSHNPGYILKDKDRYVLIDKFKDEETMSIYRSSKLCDDIGYASDLLELGKTFETSMTCGAQTTLSLYKGFHTVPVTECTHNVSLLAVTSGTAIVYLVNPKHTQDILGKDNHSIKKWSHKVVLKPGLVLSIPCQWFSFYECKGSTVMGTYEADTYPTFLYNLLR
jgi:hypothetical protein